MLRRRRYATAAIRPYSLVVLDLVHLPQVLLVVHIPHILLQATINSIELYVELLEPYLLRGQALVNLVFLLFRLHHEVLCDRLSQPLHRLELVLRAHLGT